jgi:hypothetical protein
MNPLIVVLDLELVLEKKSRTNDETEDEYDPAPR